MTRKFCLISLILIMIVLAGPPHQVVADVLNRFYIHGVPYIKQADPYWCGPASLSMVLGYWGYEINQSEVAAHVYDPDSKLTYISNMTTFPRELGFKSEPLISASIERLKEYIEEGIPLIVLQKLSYENPYGHFRIVVGYDEEKRIIITDDSWFGENYALTYETFSDLWEPGSIFTTVNWTLLIVPRNNVLKELMSEHQTNLNANYTNLIQRYERLKSAFNSLNASYTTLIEQYGKMESKFEAQTEELKNLTSLIVISLVAVSSLSLTKLYMVVRLLEARRDRVTREGDRREIFR